MPHPAISPVKVGSVESLGNYRKTRHGVGVSSEGLRDLHTSSVFRNMGGEPSLIPVYIGVYRRKDTFYRVLVNGTTGKLIGEAPLDWVKISLIVAALVGILLVAVNL